ncbi:hypothetical protein ACFLZ2_03020 [Candidatus Margulisiibacteriota bacterium]
MPTRSHKSPYVHAMKTSEDNRSVEFDFAKLQREYAKEGGDLKNWNIFSGGGIGASIGLLICLVTSLIGAPIASPDILAIVGGSLLMGIVAGYVLF